MTDEPLVAYGSEVKALDDSGRFEGYLVRWGSPDRHDASRWRDYFTPETHFGPQIKGGLDVLFHHGLPQVGTQPNPLAESILGTAEVKADGAGLFLAGVLALRDDYERNVFAGIKAGKMGLSSGTVGRLMRREPQPNGSNRITRWPIIEASITPTPADPLATAHAIKTLAEYGADGGEAKAVMAEGAGFAPANPMAAPCPECGAKGRKVTCAACGHAFASAPATKSLGADDAPPEASEAGAATAPNLADRSRLLVAGLGEFEALATKRHDIRAAGGREMSAADRESIASVADALKSLLAGVKAPDPREAEALVARHLARRVALRAALIGA